MLARTPETVKPTERYRQLSEQPRVGLALSGGVAKVVAHVGILRALREAGIRVDAAGPS